MTEPTGPAQTDHDTVRADTVEADTAEREPAEGEHGADEPAHSSGTRRKAGVEYKPL
jgi:hypothetical protein